MEVRLEQARRLSFADGRPVRAASAIAELGPGWLIAQDDGTHACWWRDESGTRVRAFPAIEGLDVFSGETGSKHLKPDLEAACPVPGEASPTVLLLGSGSTPRRMRSALVRLTDTEPVSVAADLSALYAAVAAALDVPADALNLEGGCVVGDALRWFQRGLPTAGWPTASVDLALADVLAAATGRLDPAAVEVRNVRRYDLGVVGGVGLAVTDAVTVTGGDVLVSAVAEDSPSTYDDGPVAGSTLALLRGDTVLDAADLPQVEGRVAKVEGLALLEWGARGGRLLAVIDDDDESVPSWLLTLRVSESSSPGSPAWSSGPGSPQ